MIERLQETRKDRGPRQSGTHAESLTMLYGHRNKKKPLYVGKTDRKNNR